jgi:hypothetical protein
MPEFICRRKRNAGIQENKIFPPLRTSKIFTTPSAKPGFPNDKNITKVKWHIYVSVSTQLASELFF